MVKRRDTSCGRSAGARALVPSALSGRRCVGHLQHRVGRRVIHEARTTRRQRIVEFFPRLERLVVYRRRRQDTLSAQTSRSKASAPGRRGRRDCASGCRPCGVAFNSCMNGGSMRRSDWPTALPERTRGVEIPATEADGDVVVCPVPISLRCAFCLELLVGGRDVLQRLRNPWTNTSTCLSTISAASSAR